MAQKKQADTSRVQSIPVIRDSAYIADSLRKKEIRKATKRSAIIPGWGQITNKQGWKVPLVYAGIGIPGYLFFYNKEQYQMCKEAYILRTDDDPTNDNDIPEELIPLSTNSIKFYRDEFRKNMDYSVLFFLVAWGLNVVDATVFANLRDFDVSDNISMRITPQVNPMTKSAGLGIVLKPSNKAKKPLVNTR
ncbi:MAG TPA: DUF5683 domain-containing protein [Phnomibacter sp.]|nr:DUF5683 domain-containing protein [Phnomibacter sp.]